jgi:hypothetical protein
MLVLKSLCRKECAGYIQCNPEVLGLVFFKLKTHVEDTIFFIQSKLHWHIYWLLRGHTVSEKLLKIPLFGLSLIHQLVSVLANRSL